MVKIWTCKIGNATRLPRGADGPMRDAVSAAFVAIAGHAPGYIFSGWGGELTLAERAVAEDAALKPDDLFAVLVNGSDDLIPAPSLMEAEAIAVLLNAAFARHPLQNEVPMRAEAAVWPYSAEAHAKDLPQLRKLLASEVFGAA